MIIEVEFLEAVRAGPGGVGWVGHLEKSGHTHTPKPALWGEAHVLVP
jgi:hypothetical protein